MPRKRKRVFSEIQKDFGSWITWHTFSENLFCLFIPVWILDFLSSNFHKHHRTPKKIDI